MFGGGWFDGNKNFTKEELLRELLSRADAGVSPKNVSYHSPHSCFVIGIGRDHSVSINIDDDALNALIANAMNP